MTRNIINFISVCVILAQLLNNLIEAHHFQRRSANTCGVPVGSSGLIIRGQDFQRGSFPWTVALIYTGGAKEHFFCAGTLISKNFVTSGN